MTRIADGSVRIQTSSETRPATPSWLGKVALVASHLQKQGILNRIGERVRFARRRFGHYYVVDFLSVLFGYALSGERTLQDFYVAVRPFAPAFMALFGRTRLPAWVASFGNPGNGQYREELRQAKAAIQTYIKGHSFPPERTLLRLDGQYGSGAVISDVADFAYVTRGKDYGLLNRAAVQARLHLPAGILLHPLPVGSAPLLWRDWHRRNLRHAGLRLHRQHLEIQMEPALPRTSTTSSQSSCYSQRKEDQTDETDLYLSGLSRLDYRRSGERG